MQRIQRLQAALQEQGVDLFLTLAETNVQYLTGFTGEDAGLLVSPSEARLVVDARFTAQAREDVPGLPLLLRSGPYGPLIAAFARERSLRVLGLEAHRLVHKAFRALADAFPGEVRALEGTVEALRRTKDAGEAALLERACAVAADALVAAKEVMRPGATEKDIADRIEAEVRSRGAARTSFDISVLTGPRSAQPHGRPSGRALRPGEPLLIDFGALVDGYLSDLTRVYFASSMDDTWKRIYTTVLEAQQRAIEAVAPGRPLSDVDRAGRDHIEAAGFGDAFTHAIGHGVGREIHESPGVGARSRSLMEPGMVFTVEPGLYFPDRGGVRIEDMVLVEDDGVRVLSHLEKGLDAALLPA